MERALSELSLEELWDLFPITLTPHQSCWQIWFAEESLRLEKVLSPADIVGIHHIGSTAVPGIWAKPTVDILVELRPAAQMECVLERLLVADYLLMSKEAGRRSLNRGYTPQGFAQRVFHLHLRHAGDNDELYFRDYLNEHPAAAKEYEALKLRLWKRWEKDRDAYTKHKTAFVTEITRKARLLYGDKYGGQEKARY